MKVYIELLGQVEAEDKGKVADHIARLTLEQLTPGDAFDLGRISPTGPSRIAFLNRRFFNADGTVTMILEIGSAQAHLSVNEWHARLREFLQAKSAIIRMPDVLAAQLAEFVVATGQGRVQ